MRSIGHSMAAAGPQDIALQYLRKQKELDFTIIDYPVPSSKGSSVLQSIPTMEEDWMWNQNTVQQTKQR